MEVATIGELRETYRSMADDQLLVVAAEAASLTPAAARVLKEEISRRRLSESDVMTTSELIEEAKAEDENITGKPFNLREQLAGTLKSFATFVLFVAFWAFITPPLRRYFMARWPRGNFDTYALSVLASGYVAWEVLRYLKRR